MDDSEKVELSIGLSSTYWKDPPKAKIYVNQHLIFDDSITEPTKVDWSGNLETGDHKLTIKMYDKNKFQTVVEDGKIVKTQILTIDSISFDEIDIGFLKQSLSHYYPVKENEDTPDVLTNCVDLGWNGSWELEFSTPIYIWLLEKL